MGFSVCFGPALFPMDLSTGQIIEKPGVGGSTPFGDFVRAIVVYGGWNAAEQNMPVRRRPRAVR